MLNKGYAFFPVLKYCVKPRVLLLHHPEFLSNSAQTNCVSAEPKIRIAAIFEKKVWITAFYVKKGKYRFFSWFRVNLQQVSTFSSYIFKSVHVETLLFAHVVIFSDCSVENKSNSHETWVWSDFWRWLYKEFFGYYLSVPSNFLWHSSKLLFQLLY